MSARLLFDNLPRWPIDQIGLGVIYILWQKRNINHTDKLPENTSFHNLYAESASAKKTIASVLKGQFDEIYEEAKDELSKEAGQEFQENKVRRLTLFKRT